MTHSDFNPLRTQISGRAVPWSFLKSVDPFLLVRAAKAVIIDNNELSFLDHHEEQIQILLFHYYQGFSDF